MRRTILACLVLVTLPAAWPALAAEPGRTLNEHDFMPSEVVELPFAVSSFSTITGGGLAFNVKTPFLDLDGREIGTLEGDVAFMALGFRYQQRFGNWFAARIGFGGGARLGVDEQSVLAQGVTGNYFLTFGGIARILQSRKVILSGALDFSESNLIGLDPYGFANSVIEDGLETDNELVNSTSSFNGRVSVLVGWAPMKWLGVNGYVDGGSGEVSDGDKETKVGGGVAAGVDLENLDLIPIGVQLVARTNAFTTGGADLASRSWTYGLGLYYTGWSDFSLGFEATMNSFDRRGAGDDFESFVGTFNLRYWP